MQLALRPYVTPGVAIAGAALIAVNAAVPTAVLRPHTETRPQLHSVEHHAVQLTSTPDFFGPWADLVNNTATNLAAMGHDNGWGNLLMQIFSDPSSLSRLPEVIDFLTSVMPSVSGEDPIMVLLSPILTIGMGILGPLVTVNNAWYDIMEQIFRPNDFLDPFAAIFTAVPRLLDALLNGTDTLEIAGIHIPLFNGILVPDQNLVIDLTADDVVNGLKIGDQTIAHLLDQTGFGALQVANMLTGLLDSVGLGNQTPVDLIDTLGLGDLQVASVLSTVLDAVGIGNPTIADIMDQIGIGNVQVADIAIDITHALGFDNPTITGIADDIGLGQLKIADLGMDVLNALGIGDPTVSGLLGQIGADDLTLNGILQTVVDALGLGGATPVSLLNDLGGGDLTTHEVITSVLTGLGLGNQTLSDLMGEAGLLNANMGTVFVSVLGDAGNTTILDVVNDLGLGTVTVKQFTDLLGITNLSLGTVFGNLQNMGVIGNLTINDFIAATGGTPLDKGGDTTLVSALGGQTIGSILDQQGMLNSPISALLGDMGNQTLAEVISANFALTLGDLLNSSGFANMTLTELVLANMPDQPLSELLGVTGNTPLADLINQLVPADQTIVDLLNTAGIGDLHLSDLLTQTFGDQTVANALDDGGVGSMHLDDIIRQALGPQSVNDMLNQFGIGGQSLSDLFDQFFGTATIHDELINLGLGNQSLNELVDSLFGTATVSSLLGDFGTQTVNELLTSLGLSDLTVINAQIEEFMGSLAYWLDGLPNQIAAVLGG